MRRITGVALLLVLLFPDAARANSLNIDSELEAYWGTEREGNIVEKPIRQNAFRWGISPFGAVIPNDDFYVYVPIGLRANWFPHEYVGVEVFGSYFLNRPSKLQDFLSKNALQDRPPQKSVANMGVSVLFLPFHGKIQVLSAKMLHFSVGLAAGYSVIVSEPQVYDGESKGYKAETRWNAAGGHIGGTIRMMFLDWLGFRLDYRAYLYKDDFSGDFQFPNEISWGFEFRL